nr:hypothetical protein [Mucilaginibacter sp. L294]
MKFINIITIDWYDNVIKSLCKDDNGITYYCSIVAMDANTNQKIYLCVNIEYLKGYDELKIIIQNDSFKENWGQLSKLIKLKKNNETYLLKANDIIRDEVNLISYKNDMVLPAKVLWGEYPDNLEQAAKIEDWWIYFPN